MTVTKKKKFDNIDDRSAWNSSSSTVVDGGSGRVGGGGRRRIKGGQGRRRGQGVRGEGEESEDGQYFESGHIGEGNDYAHTAPLHFVAVLL
jgi:hypothetical protein